MNTATYPHARATADEGPSHPHEPRDREGLVTGLAVTAVTIAAVLAAVMHAPPESRLDAPRHALATCAECGVVEAVVPVGPGADDAATAWQMRIRMDDGTRRTVEQRGALAAGSRVMVAGGSIRVLSHRPGQG